MRLRAGFLPVVSLLLGCAQPIMQATQRPDGAYDVTCRKRLPDCLFDVERLCHDKHYLVLRAVDDRNRLGAPPNEWEARTSQAIVVCGEDIGWEKARETVMGPAHKEQEKPAWAPAAAPPVAPVAPPPAPAPVATPPAPPADGGVSG
jgi:hypothetical protein